MGSGNYLIIFLRFAYGRNVAAIANRGPVPTDAAALIILTIVIYVMSLSRIKLPGGAIRTLAFSPRLIAQTTILGQQSSTRDEAGHPPISQGSITIPSGKTHTRAGWISWLVNTEIYLKSQTVGISAAVLKRPK
jgi:hypothetical protein